MTSKTSESRLFSDVWVEFWVRLTFAFQAFRWKEVHPISREHGAEETLPGLATKRWLPPADESILARLAAWVEKEKDPKLLEGIAAIVQRAAVGDPEFKARLLRLSTLLERTGVGRGRSVVAVQADAEIDRLLKAGLSAWRALEDVLGEEHCLPEDLLNHAWYRLTARREISFEILQVIYRLRGAMGGPGPEHFEKSKDPFWRKNGWTAALCWTLWQFFLFESWIEMIGMSDEEVEVLKGWVRGLGNQGLGEQVGT